MPKIPSLKIILLLIGLIVVMAIVLLIKLFVTKNAQPSTPPPILTANLPTQSPKELTAALPAPKIHSATKTVKKFGSLSFGTSITNPATMTIYSTTPRTITSDQIRQLVQNFGFTGNPISTTEGQNSSLKWENKEESTSLTISPQKGYLEYTNNGFFGKSTSNQSPYSLIRDKNTAIDLAAKFLREKGLYTTDLISSIQDVSFMKGSENLITTSPEDAQFIIVTFKRTIAQKNIYLQTGDPDQVYLTLNTFGMVTDVQYYTNLTLGNPTIAPILSFDTAKENLKQGQGTIVRYGDTPYDASENIQDFNMVTINSIDLGYLDDAMNNLLQPIYVFKGQALYKNSATPTSITIFLPALKQP